MPIVQFPPVSEADEHGLLAVGGDLSVDSLLLAYRSGIFPWPIIEDVLTWFAPPERGVLFFQDFHIPRSLRRWIRNHPFSLWMNRDFRQVVRLCAESKNRGSQSGTWISEDIQNAYCELHAGGFAHSIECYDGEELVGGLYGVSIGKMFAGESMFFVATNASKLCFVFLVHWLRNQGGEWMDCQMVTPLTRSFGATDISREGFQQYLCDVVSSPPYQFSRSECFGSWNDLDV